MTISNTKSQEYQTLSYCYVAKMRTTINNPSMMRPIHTFLSTFNRLKMANWKTVFSFSNNAMLILVNSIFSDFQKFLDHG
jgi:hypothetical protein